MNDQRHSLEPAQGTSWNKTETKKVEFLVRKWPKNPMNQPLKPCSESGRTCGVCRILRFILSKEGVLSLFCSTETHYTLSMDYTGRIIMNPNVMLGKPIVKGTRITVEIILRKLSEGMTIDEILTAYNHLSKEDIYAALTYASDLIANEEVIIPQAS